MQARRFNSKKDFFGQGSVFKIKNIAFSGASKKLFKFKDFYPEADIVNIEYAVVCTQDCDIEQGKVTHINFALMEPIQRQKKENPIRFLDVDFKSLLIPFEGFNFYSLDSFSQLKSRVSELLDNTNAHYMFVNLSGKFYFINLSKMYPIKFEHLDEIKKKGKFQLDGSFKHLLGWKLAYLYGRVGVDVYSKEQKEDMTKKILKLVGDSVKSSWPEETFELDDIQLKELKSLIGTYNSNKKNGKKVEELGKKIFSQLETYGVVKKQDSTTD